MLQTQKNPHEWMQHQKCTSTLQQLDGGEDAVKESYVYSTWTIFEMIRVCVTSESDMIEWVLIHWKLFAFVSCLQLAVAWYTLSPSRGAEQIRETWELRVVGALLQCSAAIGRVVPPLALDAEVPETTNTAGNLNQFFSPWQDTKPNNGVFGRLRQLSDENLI
jgi:hypothetical protein